MKLMIFFAVAFMLSGCVYRQQCVPLPQKIAPTTTTNKLVVDSNGLTEEQNYLLEKMKRDMAEEDARNHVQK